jgi:hypothetical protein
MTRKIAGTCIAAMFGFALTAAAQTPPSQPADPQQPTSMAQPATGDKMSMGKDKKMTGCVQSGTEAGSFELTNVKGKTDKMGAEAAGAAQSAAPAAARSVKLMAGPDIDLSTHVGHTVELTGSWSAAGSMAEPSAAPMAHGKGAFNVTKVKMVAATCSSGTN